MNTTERFTRREVQRLLDVTEKQLDYWEHLRFVSPRKAAGEKAEKSYDFRDLLSLRTAKQLIEQGVPANRLRSEEHTSELQSQSNLVCRLLLEKKKNVEGKGRPAQRNAS